MKRIFSLLVWIFIVWIVVSGCKKKEETDPYKYQEEEPVFSCGGNFNSLPYTIQAGVDSYYMFTSYFQDTLNLYSFIGTLKKVNCQNCTEITFQINDNQYSIPTGPSNINSLSPGNYKYWTDNTGTINNLELEVISVPMTDSIVKSVQWDFGDGHTSTLYSPTHTYDSVGNYTVSQTIQYLSGCEDKISFPFNSDYTNYCITDIESHVISGDSIYFEAWNDSLTHTYSWKFGDGTTANTRSVVHRYSKSGIYTVTLETTDTKSGCKATKVMRIKTPSFTQGCIANYVYNLDIVSEPSKTSIITIKWKDSKGVVYSTANVTQPADSYFFITSVEEYMRNENQLRTKKINANFKCYLTDGLNMVPLSGSATFAVACPN